MLQVNMNNSSSYCTRVSPWALYSSGGNRRVATRYIHAVRYAR